MKKVLVTGADGFIGSHLTENLLEKGYEVKAFTLYNSFNTWGWLDSLPKEKLDQIEIFCGDVRDPNGVREAMRGVDMVFHLAAEIIAVKCFIMPLVVICLSMMPRRAAPCQCCPQRGA